MTREEAIAEMRIIRENVERLLGDIRNNGSLSQRWRTEKEALYTRRIEALTIIIEAPEDLGKA